MNILKPSFSKLKKITGLPVLGTIPMVDFNIPEEDSLNSNPKNVSFNKKYLRYLDSEIENLSHVVNSKLNMKIIKRILE